MREVRDETFSFLTKRNIGFIPSETNFFLLDAQRPGGDFAAAMPKQNVFMGGVWEAMPSHSNYCFRTM